MKPVRNRRPSDDEAIEATAAAWLAQRDDGLTPGDAAEFARWRGSDVRHEHAVLRLEAAWAALQPLRDFRPEARAHPDADLLAGRAPARVLPWRTVATTLAAAAALVLAFVGWRMKSRGPEEPAHVYATTVDGYERVTLPDGSLLELNASSEARVHFTPGARRVELRRGEAHFTVAKNPERPFWVEAGGVAVRAVGTAFNVRLGSSDVEVLVTEGKVQVGAVHAEPSGRDDAAAANPNAPAGRCDLVANQRATVSLAAVDAAAPHVESVDAHALREALAWQGPRLTFLDTPLSVVVSQFNRRNQVQLVLGDPELEALPIGGSFRAENLEAFVRLLERSSDIRVEHADNRIVLRKKK
jgi:transmembrane sensor